MVVLYTNGAIKLPNPEISWDWEVKLPRDLQHPVKLASFKRGKQIREYVADALKDKLKKEAEQQ
jgi:hypothetical protein